jgi:hypothetical protein
VALTQERLLFQASHWSDRELAVRAFDRVAGTWSTLHWPGLPRMRVIGTPIEHDGRLYLRVEPTADVPTYQLWSVSLHDQTDARDEGLAVSHFDIAADQLVWAEPSNGAVGEVHVRDLETGEERSFDPQMGAGCGLLELKVVQDAVLLGESCGLDNGVDDNRLQVLTMDGDAVVTVRDEGVGNRIGDGGRVAVVSGGQGGPFVLDPATGELWRVGESMALWGDGVPVPDGSAFTHWTTTDWVPTGDREPDEPGAGDAHEETEWLVEWIA